jgi:DNA-binding transcriptional LysR family regulator
MSLFVAAIDTGSLSGAARISGTSLSSVSRHLSALEERLGTRLLIRTTRTLALTEAGQRYYDTSKRVLTEIGEMEAGLHTDAETPVGHLQVAGPTLFGRFFMLPLLAKGLSGISRIELARPAGSDSRLGSLAVVCWDG